ncbi:FHA domain-containing protein [Brevibacillus dissolubilis]|uniref:FHA domain-containing protein n=1 Tax=Brevibacillus dissolubilis TaxID=1844116 RepID=UPI00111600B6|nr:FHA domain-containing protein [Brevibacillus dissolubilis]
MDDWIAALIVVIFVGGVYAFTAYTYYRIGQKFGIGTLGEFFIPVYNLVLLCRCAGISSWFLLTILIPYLGAIIFTVYLYGKIAERLGKDFWLWGLGSAFLGIPAIVMAFDSSYPVGANEYGGGNGAWAQAQSYQHPHSLVARGTDDFVGPVTIQCVAGMYAGSAFPIPAEGLVIGRDPSQANLVIPNQEVSRAHVRISMDAYDPTVVIVEDLQSTNGTFYAATEHAGGWVRLNGSVEVGRAVDGGPRVFRIGNGVTTFEVLG